MGIMVYALLWGMKVAPSAEGLNSKVLGCRIVVIQVNVWEVLGPSR